MDRNGEESRGLDLIGVERSGWEGKSLEWSGMDWCFSESGNRTNTEAKQEARDGIGVERK